MGRRKLFSFFDYSPASGGKTIKNFFVLRARKREMKAKSGA
jgi:hypothetical protein